MEENKENTLTWQDVWDSYQGREDNMNESDRIRQEAIANGTWGKTKGEDIRSQTIAATENISISPQPIIDNPPISVFFSGIGGFILGVLVTAILLNSKIKRLKDEIKFLTENKCPQCEYEDEKTHTGKKLVALIICVILIIAVSGFFFTSRNKSYVEETVPTETIKTYVEMKRPLNGAVLQSNTKKEVAPLKVTAPYDYDCYCILRSASANRETIKFYVRAGESCEIMVPLGKFELYFATGNTWYGMKNLFGDETSYYLCDEYFNFIETKESYKGWTVSLNKVYNGNLSSTPIFESDFPK